MSDKQFVYADRASIKVIILRVFMFYKQRVLANF